MRTPSWVPYSVVQESGYRVPLLRNPGPGQITNRTGPSAILPPSSQPGPSLSYTGLYPRRCSGPLTLAGRPSRLNKILSLEPPTTRGAALHPLGVGLARFEVIEEDPSVLALHPPELSPEPVPPGARTIQLGHRFASPCGNMSGHCNLWATYTCVQALEGSSHAVSGRGPETRGLGLLPPWLVLIHPSARK